MKRALILGLALGASVALASCGTVSKINPFHKDKGPQATASAGVRVPVLTYDQTVKPSDSLAGVEISLPQPRAITAWPVPGGDPAQAVENVEAAKDFKVAWREGVGAGSNRKRQITATPVAVDGRIYTLDGEATVTASDARTGRSIWRARLETGGKRDKEAFGGGLAIDDGKVFVASGYRFMAALDAQTGKVIWRQKMETPIHAAPTAANGRVFVVDLDNEIFAFDQATGEQTWSYQALAEPARIMRAASPAVSGDVVVAPFSSGELVALRSSNGNPLWNEALSRSSRTNALSEIRDIPGRPAIYRGEVFAVSQAGILAAVDLKTGSSRWQLPVSSMNAPWPAGDAVYVLSKAGELIAVNRDSGQAYWLTDLSKGRTRREGGFARMGGREVKPIWTGPVLAGDRLIVVNNFGEALALDARTGKVRQTLNIGDPVYIAPIAYDGLLYVITDEGRLVAIR